MKAGKELLKKEQSVKKIRRRVRERRGGREKIMEEEKVKTTRRTDRGKRDKRRTPGVRFPAGARHVLLLHSVQTGSGAHPAS
jgi:hypothetical protein